MIRADSNRFGCGRGRRALRWRVLFREDAAHNLAHDLLEFIVFDGHGDYFPAA
jgi:hypothetical protein